MKKVLGIETSCDETAAAVVCEDKEILSNIVYSQIKAHSEYGGVVPEIASREHIKKIETVIQEALKNAKSTFDDIDAVAVTSGPGLIGGVIVGLMTAKGICYAKNKPLIAINHLEGHALTCRLTDDMDFPFLLLLVSGGHCQFIIAENLGKYKIIGRTIDDALGEAFDKTSKMLGLGYPGGPIVEKLAKEGDENRFNFPKPLTKDKNCDFSFSGLKTAVLREIEKISDEITEQDVRDICASFQSTITEILEKKVANAIDFVNEEYGKDKIKNFVISGGVAANKAINSSLEKVVNLKKMNYFKPPLKLCTDNAAMIAWAGMERFLSGNYESDLSAKPQARWSLEELN